MASPSPHAASQFTRVGLLDSNRHAKKLEPLDRKLINKYENSSEANRQLLLQPKPKQGIWDDPVILAMRLPVEDVVEDLLLCKSSGGAGTEIYRGTYKSTVVVIKMLARANQQRPNMQNIKTFFQEAKLYWSLNQLTHARLVSLVGVSWDSLSNVRIVTEFMARSDLRTYLNTLSTSKETGFDQQKTTIALHVSQALASLHALTPAVLYRDLTSRSVLLGDNMETKLGLFSLVRSHVQAQSASASSSQDNFGNTTLPSLWLAPEVMTGAKHDENADMYAFGILLSELDSNALPFANAETNQQQLPPMALLNQIALGKITVELSSQRTPQEIVELTRKCVSLEPSERPSAADAIATLEAVLSSHPSKW